MGDGQPNFGVMPHHEGVYLVGYYCWYHDQMVTGNDWKMSPQMSVMDYADLRLAAYIGQEAFETAWDRGVWAAFSALYPGINLTAARKNVRLVPAP